MFVILYNKRNKTKSQTKLTMITEDKITEIFCVADDFCKEFNAEIEKHALGTEDGKVRRKRSARMSEAEIITIIITFHLSMSIPTEIMLVAWTMSI